MKKILASLVLVVALIVSASVYSRPTDENNFQREFLDRINSVRAKGCNCGVTYMPPAPPLVWNDVLAKAAYIHAKDMYKNSYFSHNSLDGRTSEQRVLAAGYGYQGYKSYQVGENIAQGQQSIAEVSDGWLKSEGHCKNLMNPGFKEIGVAQYNDYWVQEFGGRVPFSPEQLRLIKSGKLKIIERQVQ